MRTKATLFALTLALASASLSLAAGASPQMGKWKLNESKSRFAPGSGKNTDVTYAQSGNKVKITVDGVSADGKKLHSVWVGQMDGKTYPVKGNLPYNGVAYKTVNDHTNAITAYNNGKVYFTGTITVAKDGKSRVILVSGTDDKGKKWKTKAVYDRVM